MNYGIKYYGGSFDEKGSWIDEPLPHIDDGFILVFTAENWPFRNQLLRQIFATVGMNFKPLIPDFCQTQPFERARRDWCDEVKHLLEVHGMLKISLEVRDEVKQVCENKIEF
tara:strand:- start:3155 stop:3490 length:336 start_codon:yes stop_codon:yes gene_type:complete